MKTKIQTAPPVASTDLLAVAPPSRINGKPNPEYQKWYRANPQGKQAMKNWRKSERGIVAETKIVEKKLDDGKLMRSGQCKCVECGITYDRTEAMLNGFRHLRRNRYMGICNSCG